MEAVLNSQTVVKLRPMVMYSHCVFLRKIFLNLASQYFSIEGLSFLFLLVAPLVPCSHLSCWRWLNTFFGETDVMLSGDIGKSVSCGSSFHALRHLLKNILSITFPCLEKRNFLGSGPVRFRSWSWRDHFSNDYTRFGVKWAYYHNYLSIIKCFLLLLPLL